MKSAVISAAFSFVAALGNSVHWSPDSARTRRLQFNQKSLAGVPLETIVEIRFKAGIVVVLKRGD
jgi:hypothetical protein